MLKQQYAMFVQGEERESTAGGWLPVHDPATGDALYEIPRGTADDVDEAVGAAERAFPAWSTTQPAERGRALTRMAWAIRDARDHLAELESADNGKPLRQALGDVETAARYFEFYGGAADKLHGETIPLGPAYLSYTRREPFGVVAAILPWNAPINQAGRAIAPALTTGNAVVVKPAEDTSATCVELGRIALECGVLAGVFNVVTGLGPEVGEALATHPTVRKVAFTGSFETGRHLMRLAADRMVPLTLELGGKSAALIFADADLEAAARNTATAITVNAGQICSAPSRLLVHEDVHDEVVQHLVRHNAELTLGPGRSDPDVGPLTTAAQYEKVLSYLALGVEEGAELIQGRPVEDCNVPAGGSSCHRPSFSGSTAPCESPRRRSSVRSCASCRSATRPRRS